jgi:hypothetical protein
MAKTFGFSNATEFALVVEGGRRRREELPGKVLPIEKEKFVQTVRMVGEGDGITTA